MRAYFYQCGIWTGTDSLWHGLGLNGRIKQARSGKGPGPFVVSLAGAGGKTSTIRRLAWEAVGRGLKVLVVTTTHMARPGAFGVFDGNAEEIRTVLERRSLAVAGRPAEKGKITFTGGFGAGGGRRLQTPAFEGAEGRRAGDTGQYRYDFMSQWPDIPWKAG